MDPKTFVDGLSDVGDLVATRTFDLTDTDGTVAELSISIGKPRQIPGGEDFYCPYQFHGVRRARVSCAFGVDALQALVLALNMIAIELHSSEEAKSGRLAWLGNPDLGLPFPDALRGNS